MAFKSVMNSKVITGKMSAGHSNSRLSGAPQNNGSVNKISRTQSSKGAMANNSNSEQQRATDNLRRVVGGGMLTPNMFHKKSK